MTRHNGPATGTERGGGQRTNTPYGATKRPRLVWLLAGRPLMARVASPTRRRCSGGQRAAPPQWRERRRPPRSARCQSSRRRRSPGAGLSLVLDCQGLSLVGAGAWAAAILGGRGQRGWRTRPRGGDRSGVILVHPRQPDADVRVHIARATDGDEHDLHDPRAIRSGLHVIASSAGAARTTGRCHAARAFTTPADRLRPCLEGGGAASCFPCSLLTSSRLFTQTNVIRCDRPGSQEPHGFSGQWRR